MTAWEKARELVAACIPRVPQLEYRDFGERYFFDGVSEPFSYQIIPEDDTMRPARVRALFRPRREPAKETLLGMAITYGFRTVFVYRSRVYDYSSGPGYPLFSYYWRRRKGESAARLIFLKIDFAKEEYINYEGLDLHETARVGLPETFRGLPKALWGEKDILGNPIPWAVDIEACAEQMLERSELEGFAKACAAVSP